ncbi:MAG: TonB-dependent receptor, partial [Bacteroidota bacterium]
MNRILLTAMLLVVASMTFAELFAQGGRPGGYGGRGGAPKIKGKITGTVVDNTTGEPVEFATLLIKDPKTKKDVGGGVTDSDGNFKITDVPIGSYELQVFFIGYEQLKVSLTMTPKSPDVNLGKVKFIPTATELGEVVVSADKEVIENRIDKLVYNAEKDVANSGGNAGDVLRRAPLLSVDLEGNVSLRGSQNVTILINGKPSSIVAANPADFLSVLPADEVKSVEVITTPTAKYDGEGSAGIINIVTKKKRLEGISGNVNASVGVRSNNLRLGLNTGKGRFGFNTSGSAYYSWPRIVKSEFERSDFANSVSRILSEDGRSRSDRLGFNANASAYYDFNAFRSLSSSFRIRGFRSSSDGDFATLFDDMANGINQDYLRTTDNVRLRSGYEWNVDYIIKFPGQKGKELALSYKLDGDVSDNESIIRQSDQIGNDPELFRDELNLNDGNNSESTFQIDFTQPISGLVTLETGAKGVLRTVISDYTFRSRPSEGAEYVQVADRTDIFDYGQDVLAGYVSTNWKLGKKHSLIAGVRYEYTRLEGSFDELPTNFENDYSNVLPSIIISRKLKKFSTLKGSFTRRIQRPGLRVINPFIERDNNRNISFGNPEVEPELTDQYELNYNTFIKKSTVNASLFFRRTTDIIESFLNINEEGISETTFRNIGTSNSVGTNIFISTKFFKIWTVRGGLNVFTYNANGDVDGQSLSNSALLFGGNLNSNLQLKNDWIIDASGFFRGRRQTIQGFNPAFSIFSMGFRKQLWDKKGSFGIRIVEPFFENKIFRS